MRLLAVAMSTTQPGLKVDTGLKELYYLWKDDDDTNVNEVYDD